MSVELPTLISAPRRDAGWPAEVLITVFYGFTLASIALVGQVYQLTAPAYQALLENGARVRWTDLRMTLRDRPEPRAARGVLWSNWEI